MGIKEQWLLEVTIVDGRRYVRVNCPKCNLPTRVTATEIRARWKRRRRRCEGGHVFTTYEMEWPLGGQALTRIINNISHKKPMNYIYRRDRVRKIIKNMRERLREMEAYV